MEVFEKDGVRYVRAPRPERAHHEAGHAVAALGFGRTFDEVTVEGTGELRYHPDRRKLAPPSMDDLWAGTAEIDEDVVPGWRRYLPVCFAGPIAQFRYRNDRFPSFPVRGFYGQPQDHKAAEHVATGLAYHAGYRGVDLPGPSKALQKEAFFRARGFVDQEWSWIRRVASSLDEAGTLSEKEVRALADPRTKITWRSVGVTAITLVVGVSVLSPLAEKPPELGGGSPASAQYEVTDDVTGQRSTGAAVSGTILGVPPVEARYTGWPASVTFD